MNKEMEYVITRMATERGITSGQIRGIIEVAIHGRIKSSDPVLRNELLTRFGGRKPTAEEFIEGIARMIETAHRDE